MDTTKSTDKKHTDLTQGPIFSKLLRVVIPIVCMQLMQMLYNFMDVFWMGRLSSESVAASSTAGMFLWMAGGVMLFGRVGAEIGVSQSLGLGNIDTAKKFAQNALFIGGFFGIIYSGILFFLRGPLIGFFKFQEASVANDSMLYLSIVAVGLPFDFIFSVLVGTYNASGNSKTPFFAGTAGLIINMVLDPVLIFGLNMGIGGAAISNVVGQLLSFTIMIIAMKKDKHRPFASFKYFSIPHWASIGQILKWSIPTGFENMFFTTMSMIIMRFVTQFGSQALAVNKVGSQFESLTWLLAGGFASALTAFIGQNYGAGKWTRIRKGYQISMGMMLLWGTVSSLLLYFCSDFFFGIFLPGHTEEIALGVTYGRILAICQIPQCFDSIAGSAFKGTGKTLPPFIVSASVNFLRMIAAYFLSQTSLGLHGIWLAIAVGALVRGLWGFLWSLHMLNKQPKHDLAIS